jgi:hypothetical protein
MLKTLERTLLAGLAGSLLLACQAPQQAAGIQQVDGLVGRVERMHLEADVAQGRARDAVDVLRSIVRQELAGDAHKAYESFKSSVQRSEAQADRFRAGLLPMESAAASVFDSWQADIDAIGDPGLAARARERRETTAAQYRAVVEATMPVQEALDVFNGLLMDYTRYLANDLSVSSVVALEPQIDTLRIALTELARRIDRLHKACRDYVQSAAPIGRVQSTPRISEPR